MSPLPVLVLAGGFGTRLRSVIGEEVPKPLAPVGGRPCLHHLSARWIKEGAREIVFLLHHHPAKFEHFLQEESALGVFSGVGVTSVVECVPLGTGGAVANAVRKLGLRGEFLVVNADTWVAESVGPLSRSEGPAIGVVRVEDCARYGSVELSGGKVTRFAEKNLSAGAGWINAGVYRLSNEVFDAWRGESFSIEQHTLTLLAREGRLHAVPLAGAFFDIGVPADYQRFCRWIESNQQCSL